MYKTGARGLDLYIDLIHIDDRYNKTESLST